MTAATLHLYETESCARAVTFDGDDGDIDFPRAVHGWTEVLDCRHEPYTDQSLAENCDLAHHVRKKYILVDDSQLSQTTPAG